MKKALVLAGGIPQIQLINELKKRGYFTILIDYYKNPVARKYSDKFYQESTLDVETVRAIAKKEKVNIVITCCTDQALATVSKISQELNLPCYISEDAGLAVTNKQYMKQLFREYGIPTGNFQIVQDAEQIKETNYPIVVKPVDCNSSKGVIKVVNREELKKAVRQAVSFSRTNTAIVEEYIDGEEISVDLFVESGDPKILCMSYSLKIKDKKRFVIYQGQYPAKVSEAVYQKILIAAKKIVKAFGLKNAPMLMQILKKGEEIYVIEFSARTGGCIKYHMIELASGVDVISSTVDLFEGKPTNIKPTISRRTIVDEFVYCDRGIYSHLEGIDVCEKNQWIESIYELKNPGEEFDGVQSSGDRVAALTIVAESYEEYVMKHNQVVSNLRVISKDGYDIMRHDLLPVL